MDRVRCGAGRDRAEAAATGFRWFAFTPTWADAVTVGARRVPAVDGIAVFAAGRRPGLVVAVGDERSLRLRTP